MLSLKLKSQNKFKTMYFLYTLNQDEDTIYFLETFYANGRTFGL